MTVMKRLPTAVPGFDQILHGGLFEGGVYIFEGPPGVGKTTLANQIAYLAFTKDGTKTLYITLLAESHSRMVQHMQEQTYFRPEAVNSSVIYLSAYRELEDQGLKAVIDLVRSELARHKAALFVIDGLVVENQEVGSNEGIRQFVHGLQSLASAMSCTGLLLTSGGNRALNAEQTMVDGIFAFEDYVYHWRAERRVQIRKFRGSAVERGKHTFCITDDGLQFFPRLEGSQRKAADVELGERLLALGIEAPDGGALLGGLAQGSSTVIVGDSGAGKSLLALSFAAQASTGEPCLFMTCADTPRDLVRIGHEFNLPISEAIDEGALDIRWEPQEDEGMDEIGHKLLRLVEEFDAKRLVMDSLAGLADTVAFPERGYRFVGRLLRELRGRGVTSLFTLDPAALQSAGGRAAAEGLMAWFDNVLEISHTPQADGARELNIKKIRGCRVTRAKFRLELGASGLKAS